MSASTPGPPDLHPIRQDAVNDHLLGVELSRLLVLNFFFNNSATDGSRTRNLPTLS